MRLSEPREKSPPEDDFWSWANIVAPEANFSARPQAWNIFAAMARS
jgi:hypothetical protein